MKKYIPLLLFIIGLLIEMLAFFVGNAEFVPIIYKVVSPSYFRASSGLEKLQKEKSLEPQDHGFKEISDLFKLVALKQNKPEVVNKIEVDKFVKKGAKLAFNPERVSEKIEVEVKLSNGHIVKWDLNEIEPMVDNLKSPYIFYWALSLFLVGVVIQIIGFKIRKND